MRVKVVRVVLGVILMAGALAPWAMAQAKAAGRGSAPTVAPVPVQMFRGRYCAAFGPRGWAVVAEDAERVAFGADFLSGDGMAAAGYAVGAAGRLSGLPGYQTPDSAVAMNLTMRGQMPFTAVRKAQVGPNTFVVEYTNRQSHGMALYRVFPAGPGSWMVVLRTASTGLANWQTRGAEAVAVARGLRCQVPNVPPEPAPPATRAEAKRQSGGTEEGGEADTLYNQWLDKEYYHNPRTGENFWVSPSHDWLQNGPEGPGYYAQHANEVIKLDPGYAQ